MVLGHLEKIVVVLKVVGEDFQLATAADIVADPSAPDAFVNGIMEVGMGLDEVHFVNKSQPKQEAY